MNFYDLVEHIEKQHDFSLRTFGPGARTKGLIDHIQKELIEIGKDPLDLMEWVDVIMLGLDGAWRSGHEAQQIAQALYDKLEHNMLRVWPDWRTADPDKAIEHVRTGEKTYHADPNDHDAVAKALLEKYNDQQAAKQMSFHVQELRPEVLAFALLMEARLREKDADKGQSWKNADIGNLEVCVTAKAYSLDAALTVRGDQVEAAKHAVDLANYAMMIADVAGALSTTEDGGEGWVGIDLASGSDKTSAYDHQGRN